VCRSPPKISNEPVAIDDLGVQRAASDCAAAPARAPHRHKNATSFSIASAASVFHAAQTQIAPGSSLLRGNDLGVAATRQNRIAAARPAGFLKTQPLSARLPSATWRGAASGQSRESAQLVGRVSPGSDAQASASSLALSISYNSRAVAGIIVEMGVVNELQPGRRAATGTLENYRTRSQTPEVSQAMHR